MTTVKSILEEKLNIAERSATLNDDNISKKKQISDNAWRFDEV